MKYLFSTLLILGFLSCSNEKEIIIKSKSETFTVNCNSAYNLILKNNDQLIINPNTFDCSQVDSFELTVNYLKDKKDIVLSGLQTISSDGKLLESAGIFKLDFPSSAEINPNNPVEYRVASQYAFPKMELFDYDKDANGWSKTNETLEVIGNENIKLGKESFKKNCANCHAINLRSTLTGPPLGRVEKFRNKKWLIEYTINSQAMIQKGDSLAICLWRKWRPNVMNSFLQLDTSEIEAIYAFIENEAEVKKIPIDTSNFIYPCQESDFPLIITNSKPLPNPNSDYYYIAKIYSNSWYNVDYFLFLDLDFEIENPELIVSNYENKIHAVLAFTNYNTTIQFRDYKGKHLLANSFDKDKIKWPPNEEVYIAVYEVDENREIRAGNIEKHIFTKDNNKVSITLDKMNTAEFNAKLKDILPNK